jgi:hypothetical protein
LRRKIKMSKVKIKWKIKMRRLIRSRLKEISSLATSTT